MILLLLTVLGDPPTPTLKITIDGKPIEQRWSECEARWFEFFDADKDGRLSREDVGLIPPLPNAAGSVASIDFNSADQNHDSYLSLAELRAHYRHQGIHPVSTVQNTKADDGRSLSTALARLLDRDQDDVLSAKEIKQAESVIDVADFDEDEIVTAAELLKSVELKTPPAELKSAEPPNLPAIALDRSGGAVMEFDKLEAGVFRSRTPKAVVTVVVSDAGEDRIVAGRRFLLGRWSTLLGEEEFLTPTSVVSSQGIEGLAPLFPLLDADRNQKLSTSEFTQFAELMAMSAASRVHLVWGYRGSNYFDHWDLDGDGKLSRKELATAPVEPPPPSWRVEVRRGPVGDRIGPLRLSQRRLPTPVADKKAAAPSWFSAMDRNSDGRISESEFLGRSERFRERDRNRDGVIDLTEVK